MRHRPLVLSDDGGFDDRIRSAMRNQHRLADLRQEVVVIDGAREQTLPDIGGTETSCARTRRPPALDVIVRMDLPHDTLVKK